MASLNRFQSRRLLFLALSLLAISLLLFTKRRIHNDAFSFAGGREKIKFNLNGPVSPGPTDGGVGKLPSTSEKPITPVSLLDSMTEIPSYSTAKAPAGALAPGSSVPLGNNLGHESVPLHLLPPKLVDASLKDTSSVSQDVSSPKEPKEVVPSSKVKSPQDASSLLKDASPPVKDASTPKEISSSLTEVSSPKNASAPPKDVPAPKTPAPSSKDTSLSKDVFLPSKLPDSDSIDTPTAPVHAGIGSPKSPAPTPSPLASPSQSDAGLSPHLQVPIGSSTSLKDLEGEHEKPLDRRTPAFMRGRWFGGSW